MIPRSLKKVCVTEGFTCFVLHIVICQIQNGHFHALFHDQFTLGNSIY